MSGTYTGDSLTQKLACVPRGERIVYHVGDLLMDVGDDVRFTEPERKRIKTLAAQARKLFDQKVCHLFQRRLAKGWEYLAVKR